MAEEVSAARVPPHDNEAEQSVLSSMLFEREAVAVAYETVIGEDFYRPDHRAIFGAMAELFAANVPVDVVTVKNKLEERGVLEQSGGLEYLSTLAAAYYTSAHVKRHAEIIREKAVLRRLIKAACEISASGFEASEPVDVILDRAEKVIFDISQNRGSSDFTHIHPVLLDAVTRIEKIYQTKEKITGIPTGFVDFDYKTSGLQPSDLILIAARPSMGKTALALNIAQHAAVRNHVPTALFSLEMSKEQYVNRLLCIEGMIDAQRLRTGDLQDDDWMKIVEAMESLSKAEIYIDDVAGISAAEIRAKCRKLKLEKGLGLVMIDYLQLMSGNVGRGDSRQQEISEISRSLKSLARELNVPVIAMSQLSRACETRADHRPMLSDLRESGAIEQDADVVAFLYRDEYYNPDTEKKNQAEVIIAKQRNGPTGTVELMWLAQFMKFANMAGAY